MKKYEQLDISGDAGLRVWGSTLEELFENAAEGMFNLVTDVAAVETTEERTVTLSAEGIQDLLVQWLNELVFLFDTYGLVGKSFAVNFQTLTFHAKISGGVFDPEVNESRLLIKAATYHNLSLMKINSKWEAVIIFDI